jgi:hypothetical protein
MGVPVNKVSSARNPSISPGQETSQKVRESDIGVRFCGIGSERALLRPPLMWLYGRRTRRSRA